MSYIITDTKLSNIASAVRYKCGGGSMNITTMINKLSQLKQSDGVIDVSQSSGANALSDATRIATFDPEIIDTSTMTSMKSMFAYWNESALDFQDFDTSSATDMSDMFNSNEATSLTNLTDFDTSNVTTMQSMFQSAFATSLDLSGWDVSKVTKMHYMFNYCRAGSIDLSGWNTSNVDTMSYMFGSVGDSSYSGGKMWVPASFTATNVSNAAEKPFYRPARGSWNVYTNATDATTQEWGTIAPSFIVHYNSTHQDFLNA